MTVKGDNMTGVRKNNRSAVLSALQLCDGASRKKLSEKIRLTPAAITNITAELIEESLIKEVATLKSSSAGRREVVLKIDPQAGIALGVLLNLRIATVSATYLDGSVIFSEDVALTREAPADETVALLSERLAALMKKAKIDPKKIIGLGLAIRGIPTGDRRSVKDSYSALAEKNYPIADAFERALHIPVVLENNVRAMFSAEMFLRRASSDSEFFLRCEYGIGASVVTNGMIYRGSGEQSAEIGHINVIPKGGKLCSCGRYGCLETVASPNAIIEDVTQIFSESETPILYRIVKEKQHQEITIEDIMQAAAYEEPLVETIVDRAVKHLSYALHSVVYLLDPARITLYGRMFESEYCLSRLYNEMTKRVGDTHHVEIRKSDYNEQLENRCAPLLAISEFYRNGGYRL